MYVHLGGELSLSNKWIIGVFDLDACTPTDSVTREYLTRAERAGTLELIGHEIPQSFVVTLDRIYLSPLSSETLRKRLAGQIRSI